MLTFFLPALFAEHSSDDTACIVTSNKNDKLWPINLDFQPQVLSRKLNLGVTNCSIGSSAHHTDLKEICPYQVLELTNIVMGCEREFCTEIVGKTPER